MAVGCLPSIQVFGIIVCFLHLFSLNCCLQAQEKLQKCPQNNNDESFPKSPFSPQENFKYMKRGWFMDPFQA